MLSARTKGYIFAIAGGLWFGIVIFSCSIKFNTATDPTRSACSVVRQGAFPSSLSAVLSVLGCFLFGLDGADLLRSAAP
jgi:hypothetical protein